MLAFGQQMEAFHDFTTSVVTTLIVMTSSTGGVEIYGKQFEIDPVTASVWYWLMICVMSVVCLNLILCILVESYGEAQAEKSGKEGKLPTLSEQAKDTFGYLLERPIQIISTTFNSEAKKASLSPSKVCPQPQEPAVSKSASAVFEPIEGSHPKAWGDDQEHEKVVVSRFAGVRTGFLSETASRSLAVSSSTEGDEGSGV
jgi:hypothetical protein